MHDRALASSMHLPHRPIAFRHYDYERFSFRDLDSIPSMSPKVKSQCRIRISSLCHVNAYSVPQKPCVYISHRLEHMRDFHVRDLEIIDVKNVDSMNKKR